MPVKRSRLPTWGTFVSAPTRREVGPGDHFEVGHTYQMSRASLARWEALGRARAATPEEIAAAQQIPDDAAVASSEPIAPIASAPRDSGVADASLASQVFASVAAPSGAAEEAEPRKPVL